MTRFEELAPDQRAVLELVLGRDRSYDDIAGLLAVDRTGVRARALAALDALGPVSDVPAERREAIADYLLGQLSGSAEADVRRQLETSAPDRAWALAVAGTLGDVAHRPLPPVPEPPTGLPGPTPVQAAERTGDPGAPGPTPDQVAGAAGDPGAPRVAAPRRVSRVGGAFLLATAAVVVAVVLVLVFVVNHGSKPRTPTAPKLGAVGGPTTTGTAATKPQELGTYRLKAVASGSKAQGIAEAVSEAGERLLALVAIDLPANSGNYYAVWLTRGSTTVLVGYERVQVNKTGRLQAFAPLPTDAARYSTLVVALQPGSPPSDGPKSLGTPVLSGSFSLK